MSFQRHLANHGIFKRLNSPTAPPGGLKMGKPLRTNWDVPMLGELFQLKKQLPVAWSKALRQLWAHRATQSTHQAPQCGPRHVRADRGHRNAAQQEKGGHSVPLAFTKWNTTRINAKKGSIEDQTPELVDDWRCQQDSVTCRLRLWKRWRSSSTLQRCGANCS